MHYEPLEIRARNLRNSLGLYEIRFFGAAGISTNFFPVFTTPPRSISDHIRRAPTRNVPFNALHRLGNKYGRHPVALFDYASRTFIRYEGFGEDPSLYLQRHFLERVKGGPAQEEMLSNGSITERQLERLLGEGIIPGVQFVEEMGYYSGAVPLFLATDQDTSASLELDDLPKPTDAGRATPPSHFPLRIFGVKRNRDGRLKTLTTTHGRYTVTEQELEQLHRHNLFVPATYYRNLPPAAACDL